MKSKSVIGILIFAQFLFNVSIVSADEGMHPPYSGSPAFEQIKKLAGNWQLTMDMGKGPQTFQANYKVTSGGSVVVETMMVGTPMEMINVYHDDSKKNLQMIHYCGSHNQPKMVLVDVKGNELNFDLASDADIDVAHQGHMHALALKFNGPDDITETWTDYENGQAKKTVEISYKRTQ